jgi:putative ABC transport system substrate-binding protein
MNTERRFAIIAGAALYSAAHGVLAQPVAKVWRIGVLLHNFRFERLRLRELLPQIGLEEGRNLQFEVRTSQGQADRLNALADELVAAKVDLIVAPNNPEIQAAKQATRTIPILMLFAAAPVETGLVASLARPGGNVTGTTTNAPELAGKMVEVMRDMLPGMRSIAFINEPGYPGMPLYQQSADRAAAAFAIKTETLAIRSPADIDAAFRSLERVRRDAVLVATTGVIIAEYRRIVDFMAAQRLSAIYSTPFAVREGGLVSYSPNFAAMARRNVVMIDKILKGTQPADIPVEEPAEFELLVNLRAAKALGIAIPNTILMRANEVID